MVHFIYAHTIYYNAHTGVHQHYLCENSNISPRHSNIVNPSNRQQLDGPHVQMRQMSPDMSCDNRCHLMCPQASGLPPFFWILMEQPKARNLNVHKISMILILCNMTTSLYQNSNITSENCNIILTQFYLNWDYELRKHVKCITACKMYHSLEIVTVTY